MVSQQSVERKRTAYAGCGDQQRCQILHGVWGDRGGRTQHDDQRPQYQQPDRGNYQTGNHRAREAHGQQSGGTFVVLLTKFATHRIARAVAEEEAERLHHGHDGERDADGAGLRGAKLANKERVREIVGSGHQIGDDGRQA